MAGSVSADASSITAPADPGTRVQHPDAAHPRAELQRYAMWLQGIYEQCCSIDLPGTTDRTLGVRSRTAVPGAPRRSASKRSGGPLGTRPGYAHTSVHRRDTNVPGYALDPEER